MKRGGAVKKRGGGMMGPKKKRAGGVMKKRGGGMMEKMMGGGMMGPKKKMAKGGYAEKMQKALERAKARKPSGMTGRSAAAKKAAMKGVKTKGKTLMAALKKGKGNPAGKDLSMRGALRRSGASLLAKLKKARGKKK